NHDVRRPEIAIDLCEEGGHVLTFAGIAGVSPGTRLGRQSCEVAGAARCQRHFYSIFIQRSRQSRAQASTRADDQRRNKFFVRHRPSVKDLTAYPEPELLEEALGGNMDILPPPAYDYPFKGRLIERHGSLADVKNYCHTMEGIVSSYQALG